MVHAGGVVVRQRVVRRPERGELRPFCLVHDRAGAVRRRGEDQVADHQRGCRVDRRAQPRSPGLLEADGAGGGVETDQPGAREEDGLAHAADIRRDAGGVAGLVRRGGPQHRPRFGIERHDAGVVAADVRDDPPALDQRRAGGAEEPLAHAEPFRGVDLPERISRLQADGGEPPLRAEREDAPAGHDRHGPRPFVESEIVPVGGRRVVAPERTPGGGVERFEDLAAVEPMEQQQALTRHHRPGEPFAGGPAPQLRRSPVRPVRAQRGAAVLTVAVGPQPLRPVLGLRRPRQRRRQQDGRQPPQHAPASSRVRRSRGAHGAAAPSAVIRYSFEAVRMNRLRWAIAGVAIVNSLSGFVPSSSNSGPALMTNVSPSSLNAKILPS